MEGLALIAPVPEGASQTSNQTNPFVRYRHLLRAHDIWQTSGRSDATFVSLVESLDGAVFAVDGTGFRMTPLRKYAALDNELGLAVWVKDETGNVSGSHKGRHLFGLAVLLRVVDALGLGPQRRSPPLVIASCGNAALAAAVIAAALGRRLEVFVPEDAESSVVERLTVLGATITVCPRDPQTSGDPCYHRFVDAVAAGAVPFGCQGPDNGLTIEGGQSLGWEMAEQLSAAGVAADRLVVQVGGGALASACIAGLDEAVALDVIHRRPIFDTVQTAAASPLARAVALMRQQHVPLDLAVHQRSRFMWPWESRPHSIATGILDDETYDWASVAAGMFETGGEAMVVDEATLREANAVARRTTDINVDHTGSAGLAGLMRLVRDKRAAPGEQVVVIFSGVAR